MRKSGVKSRLRIGPVGEAVLLTVGAVGLLAVAVVAPNVLQLLKLGRKKTNRYHSQLTKRNIASLMHSGLLRQTIGAHGEPALELTRKGKWEVLLRHRLLEPTKSKKWDKKWRIVVFDVPNSKGKIRAELRRAMSMYGFHMIQRSVWVYPYVCDEFVALLRSHLDIAQDVLYMTADMIENDRILRKDFNL